MFPNYQNGLNHPAQNAYVTQTQETQPILMMPPGTAAPLVSGYPLTQTNMVYPNMIQPNLVNPATIMMETNPIKISSGYEKLLSIPGVYIVQKTDIIELTTQCDRQNKYVVYAASETGEKTRNSIFKAKEKSNFLTRLCLR